MIHAFAICNIETGLGHEIYMEDKGIRFDPTLLWPLIGALSAFSKEFMLEEKLRSIHLAEHQLVIYNPYEEETDPIAYIVLQDAFDNIGYTRAKIDAINKIMRVFTRTLLDINFSKLIIPKKEIKKIRKIIQFSQHFPDEISEDILKEITRFQANTIGMEFISLYIADVDEGIINQFGHNDQNERAIFQSFIPIIPMNKDLWFEATREDIPEDDELDKEGWIVKRIGKGTDFYLMGRFYYNTEIKPFLDTLLIRISSQLYDVIKTIVPKRPF
ncbi:MAG: hypothetical protein ACFFDC_18675 [Promethearchaeota archaeon]